jgi:hypothetical protein
MKFLYWFDSQVTGKMVSREKRFESNLNIVGKATIITTILKYKISVSKFSTQLQNKNYPLIKVSVAEVGTDCQIVKSYPLRRLHFQKFQ